MKALRQFGLTLVVNHACNLRCSYCYTGAKFSAPMDHGTGVTAIERGFRSLIPRGHLDIGFFGGEPLLESPRILDWMTHARASGAKSGAAVRFNVTTNGTISHQAAWQVMMAEDLELAVSFDGNPDAHDRHRRDTLGCGSAAVVAATLQQLLKAGKSPCVVMVVRPDNLEFLPRGLNYLRDLGVREVHLSLDLWCTWTSGDGRRLGDAVDRIAVLWRQWLPDFSLNWFDAKAAQLAGLETRGSSTRCGFGRGEIAVAPSGRLYPCERLVGEDRPGNHLCLPGDVSAGIDFLNFGPPAFQRSELCSRCALVEACDTTCRCSNFIRTGDVNRPDGLLCILSKAVAAATVRVLGDGPATARCNATNVLEEGECHAR